jgi:excisionase family DNA binding protein
MLTDQLPAEAAQAVPSRTTDRANRVFVFIVCTFRPFRRAGWSTASGRNIDMNEGGLMKTMETTKGRQPFEQQARVGAKAGSAGIPACGCREHSCSPFPAATPAPAVARPCDAPPPSSEFPLSAFPISALPLLTRRDLAAHLQVSVRTIDRLVASGELPTHRIGRIVRFSLPDVLAAL